MNDRSKPTFELAPTAPTANRSISPNGVHSFRAVDGRVITVTVERARVPVSLAPLPPVVVAAVMLFLVLAAAAVSVWVVLS
jgi:hypothetical protein